MHLAAAAPDAPHACFADSLVATDASVHPFSVPDAAPIQAALAVIALGHPPCVLPSAAWTGYQAWLHLHRCSLLLILGNHLLRIARDSFFRGAAAAGHRRGARSHFSLTSSLLRLARDSSFRGAAATARHRRGARSLFSLTSGSTSSGTRRAAAAGNLRHRACSGIPRCQCGRLSLALFGPLLLLKSCNGFSSELNVATHGESDALAFLKCRRGGFEHRIINALHACMVCPGAEIILDHLRLLRHKSLAILARSAGSCPRKPAFAPL
mmetsp:Transcript_40204/g.69707  ORF Transcript_40204/g.69707 Transcript_40204/m.69707 type:complete len:267 (+) Transcript_40204:1695-2495(+)